MPTSQAAGGVTEVETRECQSPVLLCDLKEASPKQKERVHVYQLCKLVCMCIAEHNLCVHVCLLIPMKEIMTEGKSDLSVVVQHQC